MEEPAPAARPASPARQLIPRLVPTHLSSRCPSRTSSRPCSPSLRAFWGWTPLQLLPSALFPQCALAHTCPVLPLPSWPRGTPPSCGASPSCPSPVPITEEPLSWSTRLVSLTCPLSIQAFQIFLPLLCLSTIITSLSSSHPFLWMGTGGCVQGHKSVLGKAGRGQAEARVGKK